MEENAEKSKEENYPKEASNNKSIDYLILEPFLKLNSKERFKFIDRFMSLCDPSDLMHLNKKLNEYKRDFISLLPIEIAEQILGQLDWKTLLNCCQVIFEKKKFYNQNLNSHNLKFSN